MKAGVLLIIAMILIGMFAIGAYFVYKATQIRILPWLSEEIGERPILTSATLDIKPGDVIVVNGTKEGWIITKKNTRLYEKITLDSYIGPGDVIAPHIYDWYMYDPDTSSIVFPHSDNYDLQSFKLTMIVKNGRSLEGDNAAIYLIRAGIPSQYRLGYHGYGSDRLEAGVWNTSNSYNVLISVPFEETSNWWNWTITYDGSEASLYVNDVLVTSSAKTVTVQTGTSNYFEIVQSTQDTDWYVASVILKDINGNYKGVFDASFFNGTHYIDIVTGNVATVSGKIKRVPSEKLWLYHIPSIEQDGYIHFKYFPKGSIIILKDAQGNIIRKIVVDEVDEKLDVDTPTPNYIEVLVPSEKVRIYAPQSSVVSIEKNDVVYAEAEVTKGYVDLVVDNLTDANIVVAAKDLKVDSLRLETKINEKTIEVKVIDENNVLVPGMLVRIIDPAGIVVYANVTDQEGKITYTMHLPYSEVTLETSGIWQGKLYYATKTITLTESISTSLMTPPNTNKYQYLLLGLLVIAAIAITFMVVRR